MCVGFENKNLNFKLEAILQEITVIMKIGESQPKMICKKVAISNRPCCKRGSFVV